MQYAAAVSAFDTIADLDKNIQGLVKRHRSVFSKLLGQIAPLYIFHGIKGQTFLVNAQISHSYKINVLQPGYYFGLQLKPLPAHFGYLIRWYHLQCAFLI